ncbi:hypothetical protein ABMB67_001797 [Halalkalibacter oceani]
MYKVMLIEDDVQLSELVQDKLERYGYDVYQPNDFMKVEEAFVEIEPSTFGGNALGVSTFMTPPISIRKDRFCIVRKVLQMVIKYLL